MNSQQSNQDLLQSRPALSAYIKNYTTYIATRKEKLMSMSENRFHDCDSPLRQLIQRDATFQKHFGAKVSSEFVIVFIYLKLHRKEVKSMIVKTSRNSVQ